MTEKRDGQRIGGDEMVRVASVLFLRRQLIEQMPWFPAGATLRAVHVDYQRDGIAFCVEGYGWPVLPGCSLGTVEPDEVRSAANGILIALRWPILEMLPCDWMPEQRLVSDEPSAEDSVGMDGCATRDIAKGEEITMPLAVYRRIMETGSSHLPDKTDD